MTQLETPRLSLLALSLAQLETYGTDPAALSRELGIILLGNPQQPGVAHSLQTKLESMRGLAETQQAWVTYWLIILRQERMGAGLAGFKGQPDALGRVEIGYGLDRTQQNKGYMTEAVRCLAGWAFQQPGCLSISAEIQNSNGASIRVVEKVGAQQMGRDGEKTVYQLTPANLAGIKPE